MNQHGDARVPRSRISDNSKLGRWISKQRQEKSNNRLSQDRIKRLEAIPEWSWNPHTEQWDEWFEQLQTYVNLYGDAKVPQRTAISGDSKLGSWVNNQRQEKSNNRLSQDRIERLEALPGWSWDPFTGQWEEAFERLQLYMNLNGDARVSRNCDFNGYKLGVWVGTQRSNKSKNSLSQDQIKRLEALPGWSWDTLTEQWEEAFEKLQSYVNLNGDARVPRSFVSDGFKLGSWVKTQRSNKSKNLLSQDRVKRLEAFPRWSWDPFTEQWEEAFGQLQTYVNLNGDALVSKNCVTSDDFNLGNWVSTQRQTKSKNSLSQDRIERLEALPGWVWSFKKEIE